MRIKKIWHLLSNRWYSAITEYALNAARALQLQGHHCLLSPLQGSPAEAKACELQLGGHAFANFHLSQVRRFQKLATTIQPDIIVTYGGPESFLCHFLPTHLKCLLVRFRGQELREKDWRLRPWLQLSSRQNQLIITPSERLASQVNRIIAPPWPLKVVPLGIDSERFCRLSPSLPRAQDERPELMILGRLDPIKGHFAFLDIFASLLSSWREPLTAGIPKPRLHIVGEPANLSLEALQARVNARGLQEDVVITAERLSQLATFLNRSCVGVVSSLGSEEICRVAQEFLLCGTPLFVSGVGALEETLFTGAGESYRGKSHGETVQQLRQVIIKSYRETAMAKELRASLAKRLFSLQAMGRKLEKAFAAALSA